MAEILENLKITAKDTLIYSIGNIATKIIGFVLLPLYTGIFTTSEYGILGIMEISLQVLVAFFSVGIYTALARLYWDKEFVRKQKSLFFTAFVSVLFFSCLMLLIVFLNGQTISLLLLGTKKYVYLVRLMTLSAFFQILTQVIFTLMRLQRKTVLYSTSNIIKLLITLLLTIYLLVYAHHKIEGIYEAQIVGYIILLVVLVRFTLKNLDFSFHFSVFREMFSYGYPLAISAMAGVLLSVADRYCLQLINGLEDVGLYSLGYKIANTFKVVVVASVQLSLTPIKYKMLNKEGDKRFYSKSLTYISFVIMFLVIGLSAFSKEVVELMAQKKEFWVAYNIVPIIALGLMFEMLRGNAVFGLNVAKKTGILSVLTIIISALNIGLNFLLIPTLGIYGASIATLFSQLILFILIYRKAQKEYFIPYELSKIILVIISGSVLIALSFLANDLSLLMRLLLKVILLISFPFLLYFLGFYEKIEIVRIKEAWNKWRILSNWWKNS
ncbi:MAG TPA: oligosaccharide flippase family protein [Sunxiuqinia sp.]|nr:oligosaccharide flippase family protein [Sunxiuqinia sp.]